MFETLYGTMQALHPGLARHPCSAKAAGRAFRLRVPALVSFPVFILGLTHSIMSKGTPTGEFNR